MYRANYPAITEKQEVLRGLYHGKKVEKVGIGRDFII